MTEADIKAGKGTWWRRIDPYRFCVYDRIYVFHRVPMNDLCMRGQIGIDGVSSILTIPIKYPEWKIVSSILEGYSRSITVAEQLSQDATLALSSISDLEAKMEEV